MKRKKKYGSYELLPGTILWYNPNAPRRKGIPKTYSSMELRAKIKKLKRF